MSFYDMMHDEDSSSNPTVREGSFPPSSHKKYNVLNLLTVTIFSREMEQSQIESGFFMQTNSSMFFLLTEQIFIVALKKKKK